MKCKQCGCLWAQVKMIKPSKCPKCNSPDWDKKSQSHTVDAYKFSGFVYVRCGKVKVRKNESVCSAIMRALKAVPLAP